MINALTAIPCIVNASLQEAEKSINELSVREKLGGHDPFRRSMIQNIIFAQTVVLILRNCTFWGIVQPRSVALALVGQLCLRLDERSSHLTTQLNIICKNLASALRSFSSSVDRSDDNPSISDDSSVTYNEGLEFRVSYLRNLLNFGFRLRSDSILEQKRELGRMTCIGTLGLVLQRWSPVAQQCGVADVGFLVWPCRTLLSAVVAQRRKSRAEEILTDSDLWCRSHSCRYEQLSQSVGCAALPYEMFAPALPSPGASPPSRCLQHSPTAAPGTVCLRLAATPVVLSIICKYALQCSRMALSSLAISRSKRWVGD